MEKYDIIKKKLCEELDAIGRKLESGAAISVADLDQIDKISHALKSLAAYAAMENHGEHDGMSGRYGRSYGGSMDMGGNSYADAYNRGYNDARNNGSGMMYPPMYRGYGFGERNW